MRILVVGIGEIPHLGQAFRLGLAELGHSVGFVDERDAFGWLDRHRTRSVVWRLRRKLPTRVARFNANLVQTALRFQPEVILSVKGTYIAPDTLRHLRAQTGATLVNYSTDDPFNPASSNHYIEQSLPYWHVYATPRPGMIAELKRRCPGKIVYLPFGYDPQAHFPEPLTLPERNEYGSDLVFIGVCDRDRAPLLESLSAQSGLNVHLYGGGRYAFSRVLRARHRGFANGRAYRCALSGSKIAFSLLRRANRDTHVMRTFEIPACGAFMLAERTDEHRSMFREGEEAEFFEGPEEMTEKIRFYLAHASKREAIAKAGYVRVTRGRNTYKDRLEDLLGQLGS